MKQIAEQQVSPALLKKVAPDVTSREGQQKLMAKTFAAQKMKDVLDKAFGLAAKSVGGTSSSRIKNSDTVMKKIVVKRIEGRKDYGLDNVNDLAGFRITIDKHSDQGKILNEVKSMEKAGLFKIDKSERVDVGTYSAHHVDFTTPDGSKGELQIMVPQEKATSLINHSLRSQYGENPPEEVKVLQDAQAKITDNLSNPKAETVSRALTQLMKQNNDKPLHPMVTAKIAQQAQT